MKVVILQQDLLPALQAVSRSAGVRTTLPVLANILIQAEPDILKLSATNLELGVIKRIKAKVQEEGETTVPAKTLLEIVSSLGGSEITLESSSDQLNLTTPHFNATFNGIAASEFPAIPLSSDSSVSLLGEVVKKALPEIAFAAAIEEGRPVLTGILTELKGQTLELVATDGFRLAHKKTKLAQATGEFKALIPRRTFEEVIRLIAEDLKGEDLLQIATSEDQNQILFKIGSTEVSSRLIEGQFPAWERIVPTQFITKAQIDRAELLKAVKLASVFARGDSSNIIKLQLEAGKINITSQARELGGQETVLETPVEGESLLIAFNSKFLIEALQAFSSEQATISFSGNLSPTLITPVGEEGLEYVVMPVRLY